MTTLNQDNIEQLGQQLKWQHAKPGSAPILDKHQIHLWYLPLKLNKVQTESALKLLNDTQRNKYHRRATQQLQQAYLAGRFYLLTLLAAYSRIDANEIQISYNRLNKPYLNPNPADIQFNFTDTLTPSGHCGLFAFCRSRAIGVDIESFNRSGDFSAITAKRFSSAETEYVTNADGKINSSRFLAYWTRKEAFGKAVGCGINFRMCEMDLASPGKFELNFTDNKPTALPYRLLQIQIGQQIIASVVHEHHQPLIIKGFSSTTAFAK